jgi:hypothetical protein
MTEIPFEQLAVLWDDGERRLKAATPAERRLMEPIIEAIVAELRRRTGGPFAAEELGELYLAGTDWCFDIATKVMPSSPEAWDMPTVIGTAFARYVRRARDFGGGRRWLKDEDEQ